MSEAVIDGNLALSPSERVLQTSVCGPYMTFMKKVRFSESWINPAQFIFPATLCVTLKFGGEEIGYHHVPTTLVAGEEEFNRLTDLTMQSNFAAQFFADFASDRLFRRFVIEHPTTGEPELIATANVGTNHSDMSIRIIDDCIGRGSLATNNSGRRCSKHDRGRVMHCHESLPTLG